MIRRLLLTGLLLLPVPAFGQQDNQRNTLIVILVPGLRADDLARPELPMLREIVARGAFGWMNTRTARIPGFHREPPEAAYLTLGAGGRATAGPYARVVTPDSLARLTRANSALDHPVHLGLLGDILRADGRSTQVFGAADAEMSSEAAKLLAMDRSGKVDLDQSAPAYWAAVGAPYSEEVEPPALSPYGLQTDPIKQSEHVSGGDLTVLCFGDLDRADRYARLCSPAQAAKHRASALSGLSDFLFIPAVSSIYSRTRCILMAPCPADSAPEGDRLAPILMWGHGVKPGLLTSGSTRTPGLVTNTDFLPTVAQYFGLMSPRGLVGRPMTVSSAPSSTTPESWAAMHEQWYTHSLNQAVFGGLPTLQFLLVLGSLLPFLPLVIRRTALPACIVALPLALLALPPISPDSVALSGAILAAALFIFAGLACVSRRAGQVIALASSGILVAAVTIDLLTGSHLLRQAWMSYSVMEGARYYGIGNEYAGAVFAAMMAVSLGFLRGAGVADRWRWPAVAAALLAVCLVIGHPRLGANAGGFLGAALGCGTAALVWWRDRIRTRDMVILVASAAAIMGLFLLMDRARSGADQSHIARALGGGALGIAARKAMLNGYLITHSPWTLGLLSGVYGLARLWRLGPRTDRSVRGVWAGLAAGTSGLLLLNDSGVIAAAECLLVAFGALTLLLQDKSTESNECESAQ